MTIMLYLFLGIYLALAITWFLIALGLIVFLGNFKRDWWIPPVYGFGWPVWMTVVMVILWRNP